MKPRQRRVAAGAADLSVYPDRPLTALRRWPFLPTRPSSSFFHLLYTRPAAASPFRLSPFARPLTIRATIYILPHCAPSLSTATRAILTF